MSDESIGQLGEHLIPYAGHQIAFAAGAIAAGLGGLDMAVLISSVVGLSSIAGSIGFNWRLKRATDRDGGVE